MDITQYQFTFKEIEIERNAIAKLMGYEENGIPEQILDIINSEIDSLPNTQEIMGGYTLKDCRIDKSSGQIKIENTTFNVGSKITHLLRNTEKVAIFACTAGKLVSDRSKKLMENGDILEGYIVDIIGSTLVEKGMDKIHLILQSKSEAQNLKISNRYSPGYCDWHVEEQQKLFSFLPNNFCDISLSKSSLMIPIKSVSGFIGLGPEVIFNKYTCDICTQSQCIYRNLNTDRVHIT